MKRSTAALILFVSVWMVAISGMALHAALVDAGESYEHRMKIASGASIGVGCAIILYVLYTAFYGTFN